MFFYKEKGGGGGEGLGLQFHSQPGGGEDGEVGMVSHVLPCFEFRSLPL